MNKMNTVKFFYLYLLTVLFLFLTGCEERTVHLASKVKTNRSLRVGSDADLPQCNSINEGELRYVMSTSSYRACIAGSWLVIPVAGVKGDVGEKGDKGDPGPTGQNGKDGQDGEDGLDGQNGQDGDDGQDAINLAETYRNIWKANISSVAFILTIYKNRFGEQFLTGTGFIVGQNLIATAGHVISPLVSIGGERAPISAIEIYYPTSLAGDTSADLTPDFVTRVDRTISDTDDIALLEVSTGKRASIPLSTNDESPLDRLDPALGVALGDDILSIGYSGGLLHASFAVGRIAAIQLVDNVLPGFLSDGKLIYQLDVNDGGGVSGGPVFNLKGEVIGMTFAGFSADSDLDFSFATQVRYLKSLLMRPRLWTEVGS